MASKNEWLGSYGDQETTQKRLTSDWASCYTAPDAEQAYST